MWREVQMNLFKIVFLLVAPAQTQGQGATAPQQMLEFLAKPASAGGNTALLAAFPNRFRKLD